ncbi:MAG: ugpC [Solirubrobacterales bacterium]|nr:ugpC [Solirubrobacterales bacterium]
MAHVELDHLTKRYPNGSLAVQALDLGIEAGEFLVLVGPSGCGKTTALRMVAGLEEITEGHVRIGGTVVDHVAPQDRDIAMVFQNYALYPHMSVRQNIAYGLRMRKVEKAEIGRRIDRVARMLDVEALLDRRPGQLSGGQRQRVAMGRAIVRDPQAFLMDEPLSNLDAKLRVQMRAEISAVQRDLGTTTIYVTHDQVEAMTMGDRVAVMHGGLLQQVESPQRLYDEPANLFVAGFIGTPPMNLALATVQTAGDAVWVALGDARLRVPEARLAQRPALRGYDRRQIAVGIRAEDLGPTDGRGEESTLAVGVRLVEALGPEELVHLVVDAPAPATPELADAGAAPVGGPLVQSGQTRWVASVRRREAFAAGERATVGVDVGRLHFFDLDSGAAIMTATAPATTAAAAA